MYCDGSCEHLDCKKKKCIKFNKKLAYCKHRGSVGFTVFEKCDECKFPERFVIKG